MNWGSGRTIPKMQNKRRSGLEGGWKMITGNYSRVCQWRQSDINISLYPLIVGFITKKYRVAFAYRWTDFYNGK